ncbi:MAG: ABC transporter permease [Bacteroidales bacterium]
MKNNHQISTILNTLHSFYEQRYIMKALVVRDFKSRYLSSFIGLPWAFVQPAVYVTVIWFAFTFGLRAGTTSTGLPFGAWLIVGMIPWLFIGQTMIVVCNSITEYAYLIKKTSFQVGMIPVIKIFSGLIVHVILIGFTVLLLTLAYGFQPTIHWIQIFYYLFVLIFLLTGIALFVASVNVFVKDMAHIINILTTILFWATPIIWPFSMLQGNYRYIALLNPFFYITEGYRYTFIEKRWFFEFTEMNLYFWTIALITFFGGIWVFNRLKPDFGDEL